MLPKELTEVICASPLIWPNCRSSGVVTDEAITSGLAPGILGGDLDGGEIHAAAARRSAAGSSPAAPISTTPAISSEVAIGRLDEWLGDAHTYFNGGLGVARRGR